VLVGFTPPKVVYEHTRACDRLPGWHPVDRAPTGLSPEATGGSWPVCEKAGIGGRHHSNFSVGMVLLQRPAPPPPPASTDSPNSPKRPPQPQGPTPPSGTCLQDRRIDRGDRPKSFKCPPRMEEHETWRASRGGQARERPAPCTPNPAAGPGVGGDGPPEVDVRRRWRNLRAAPRHD